MHKKFEINQTKIKDGYQLGGKVVTHNSMSDLPLVIKFLKTAIVHVEICALLLCQTHTCLVSILLSVFSDKSELSPSWTTSLVGTIFP